jgi:iron complex outermembrane receptor protein
MSKRKNNRAIGKQSSRLHQTINGLVLASVLVVSPSAMADVDASAKRNYHISSGSLSSALSQFAGSAGILLSVDARMTDGKSSKGLDGEYTVEQGLQKLLAGSGLVHAFNGNTVTLKVLEHQGQLDASTLSEVTVIDKISPSLTTPSMTDSKAKLNRVPGGTTVIDGARIREGATVTVTDTLASAPGVYVGDATTGAAGPSRISIRGSDVNSTSGGPMRGLKVLRNGMPFTRANGAIDTQLINLYAIDHIDVYRGASALEYGGSNLGGALNFITPTGYTADPLKIGMIWGTNGHVNPTVSAARVFDNGFDVYGAFSYLDTNTTRKNNDQETSNGHGNIGYRWNENQETRLSFDIQENNFPVATGLTKQQIDINPRMNNNSFSLGNHVKAHRSDLKHSVKLDNGDKFDVGAYYFNTQFDFDFTSGMNRDRWQDTGFNWRHEINGNLLGFKNRVIWGGLTQWMFINDWNYSTVNRQRGPLLNAERDKWLNVEGYMEDQLSLTDTFTLVAGLQLNYRKVDYERYEGYVASAARPSNQANKDFFVPSPKLGFTWEAAKNLQIYGNLSRSSEPPLLSNLSDVFLTPALDIQTANTVEIGTRGERDRLKWDLAFYQAWVNNEYLIIPSPPFGSRDFTATNANSTTLHRGIELGLETTVPVNAIAFGDQIRFSGNYTWNDFRFDNDRILGDNRLPAIPEHNARFEAVYQHPSGFYIGPNVQAVSSNWVDFANTLAAKPYALLGARMGWDDGKHWKIFVDGRNLNNEHFASAVWVMGNANGLDAAQFNVGATRQVFAGFEYRY